VEIEKLQILSNHYSHTFDFLQTHLKNRDRLFLVVLVLLAIMVFQIYTPIETSKIISQLVTDKLCIKSPINFLYIQSIIWFVLLAIVIKYFQSVIFIERQYSYLHSIENILSKDYKDGAFTREGKSYLDDYPVFLNWASFLYTILFPAILAIVTTSKIIGEYKQHGCSEILVWFNGLIFLFIIVSLTLYIYGLHFKKKSTYRDRTPHR
jgi:hypothetical protein